MFREGVRSLIIDRHVDHALRDRMESSICRAREILGVIEALIFIVNSETGKWRYVKTRVSEVVR
jgi:hypothetical protein